MKTATLFSLLLAPMAMAADKPAKCNADNCARAVTGTNAKQPLTVRQSDCSKYMTTTVTPEAVTVTSTVRTIITAGPVAPARRGQAGPRGAEAEAGPTVPAYAATCAANGATTRYSSACACWGITAATVTAAAPTTTVTATATATACAGSPGTCDNGYLDGRGLFACNGGSCSCSPGDGRNVCYQHGACGTDCATDADCAAEGRVCVSETCCGRSVCLVPADACPNTVAARRLFRAARAAPALPRDVAEGACTSLNCPARQGE